MEASDDLEEGEDEDDMGYLLVSQPRYDSKYNHAYEEAGSFLFFRKCKYRYFSKSQMYPVQEEAGPLRLSFRCS